MKYVLEITSGGMMLIKIGLGVQKLIEHMHIHTPRHEGKWEKLLKSCF
jgi:hypothetical protein